MKSLNAILLALLVLAGCATEYTYTPPATEAGRQCVAKCERVKADCRAREDHRAQDEYDYCVSTADRKRDQCERDANVEYNACLRFAKNDKDRSECHLDDCSGNSCYNSRSYGQCDTDYRGCYQNCGGTVGILK